MVSKEFVYKKVLPLVKEKSRLLEYYMIQSLYENKDREILKELLQFQNEDGGFGHGLEPDVQMPFSSVFATNIAIKALSCIKDESLKEKTIKDIVHYFEDVYNEKTNRFSMTEDKRIDDYPHAVWWNFDQLNENFRFGNPDPEVIGFLYANEQFMRKLDIDKHINDVINYVLSSDFDKASMHQLMSTCVFYRLVDEKTKNRIYDRLAELLSKHINEGLGKWEEYSLEPYKIYIIEPSLLNPHIEVLNQNLVFIKDKINSLQVMPNWNWYQYEAVFEKVKYDWVGHMYYEMILALTIK